MSDRRSLDVIQVGKPCTADWEAMSGDEQRRFCAHCNKYVHNLSAMPDDQAQRLVCDAAGSLCVRFARDPASGKVLTLNYAPAAPTTRRRAIVTIASIFGSVLLAGGWGAYRALTRQPPAVRMPVLMGDMVMPPPPPPTPQTNNSPSGL